MAAKRNNGDGKKRQQRRRPGFWHGARANFLTGLVVVAPVVLTLYLTTT